MVSDMALTNEQVASLDENSVLRVVRGHGLLGTEGTLVRYRPEVWHARRFQRDYVPAQTLEGARIDGSWYPDRFDLVEPQPVTGPLPAGTLLRCIDSGGCSAELTENTFYRLLDMDDSFMQVNHLNGGPVKIDGGSVPFGFYPRRFVYYPDSAPAEPTTEKGTTMSNTTTLTREAARTLPIGARVVFTDSGERHGKVFILDRAGIDSDGDFHGTFEGADYNHFLSWSYFSLPHGDLLQSTPSDDDWKAKFERLIAALGEEAERREWCPEFDSFMEKNGFEGLCGEQRTFTVKRTATIEWDTQVQARSQEHAERLARELDDPGYIYSIEEQDRYGDVSNVEVESVEEA
jgi:hypothetical protein